MQAVFLLKKTQVTCISEVMHRKPVWEFFPGLNKGFKGVISSAEGRIERSECLN
jgi:hypothetical protein